MLLFVVNEKAAGGRGKRVWAQVEKELQRRGTAYRKIAESSEADAIRKMKEQLSGGKVKAVAAIGGDGSIHSLLPLLAGSGVPLGLIPAGSGNDTARAFAIPRRPLAALDAVLAGRTQPSDLLRVRLTDGTERLTLTALATGLDAAVAADVNGSRYKIWCNRLRAGSLAYIIGLLRTLMKFKPGPVSVTVDGAQTAFASAWLIATANVSSYGGGLRICPAAGPSDGQLHVCVVHGCSKLRLLSVFPTLLTGSHVRLPYVTILKGTCVRIESASPLPSFGDGEPVGGTPLTVRIDPAQLLILTGDVSG